MDLDRHRDLQDRSVHRSSLETTGFSSDHRGMDTTTRRYRFTITVDVKPDHPAYDDPEWAADAAWGSLTNEYGLPSTYEAIEEVAVNDSI